MRSGASPPVSPAGSGQASSFETRGARPSSIAAVTAGDVAGGDEPRQRVERDAAARVGCGGEHRLGVEQAADVAGKRVGAAGVTADERHRVPARLRRRRRRRGHGPCRRAAARRSGRRRRWRGTARSRRPIPIARARRPPPTRARARTEGGAPAPGPPRSPTRTAPAAHDSGPHTTNTGFSACSRTPPASGMPRATATSTRLPESLVRRRGPVEGGERGDHTAARAQPGEHGVEHGESATADEDPVGIGQRLERAGRLALDDLDRDAVRGGVRLDATRVFVRAARSAITSHVRTRAAAHLDRDAAAAGADVPDARRPQEARACRARPPAPPPSSPSRPGPRSAARGAPTRATARPPPRRRRGGRRPTSGRRRRRRAARG